MNRATTFSCLIITHCEPTNRALNLNPAPGISDNQRASAVPSESFRIGEAAIRRNAVTRFAAMFHFALRLSTAPLLVTVPALLVATTV